MSKPTATSFHQLPKSYSKLCAFHLPRPIHDDVALRNATELIDRMAGHKLNADQEDYLDILSDLVATYEDEHHPLKVGKLTAVEALTFLLNENGMSAADLAQMLGADRSLGSKILRGERRLTAEHIRTLTKHFAVDAGLFLG